MQFLEHFEIVQNAWRHFRFPYGSSHTFAYIWLYTAICKLLFFLGFRFGLYCVATRFSSLFEIFDFGNSRGSYFENLVFIVVFTQVVEICQLPAFSFGQIPKPLRLLGSFSPVPLGTYDSRYCSLSKLERVLNLPIRQPHLRPH